jgi:hypothetical protein
VFGAILECLGALSNTLVIRLNDGMPINHLEDNILLTWYFRLNNNYVAMTPNTRLPLLADIIPVGNFRLSIGDILIWIGITLILRSLIIYLCTRNKKENKVALSGSADAEEH